MGTGKKISKEPEWIHLDEGTRRVYVYTHPDPAIHERFSIKREAVKGRKTPYWSICDTLGRIRGYHHRLSEAKIYVESHISFEADNPGIRIQVGNEIARGNIAKAFMNIIDHFEKRIDDLEDQHERRLDSLVRNLRNV